VTTLDFYELLQDERSLFTPVTAGWDESILLALEELFPDDSFEPDDAADDANSLKRLTQHHDGPANSGYNHKRSPRLHDGPTTFFMSAPTTIQETMKLLESGIYKPPHQPNEWLLYWIKTGRFRVGLR